MESRTLDWFTNLTKCCDMFKKSLTRLNFAPPSSQLFCNLIEIVKADPLPDPLFPILLNMRKSSTSLFCVGRYYLCYFPQHILNIEQTFLRFKKSCLNFAQRQTCLVAITSPLSPLPYPKNFKLNPLRLFYFTQEGFIGQFCDCLQI